MRRSASTSGKIRAYSNNFKTPSEVIQSYGSADTVDVPHIISWADTERDLSAWLGNAMQSNAIHELYRIEKKIKDTKNEEIIGDWRKLQTSDHFYYMCTKYFADGDVHKYFNPYDSPYDSYINFMNVLDHLHKRCSGDMDNGALCPAPGQGPPELSSGPTSGIENLPNLQPVE
jgi:alpha-amylase/alpha-mannosidase (GH57 family)